jgi:hypothetical protein
MERLTDSGEHIEEGRTGYKRLERDIHVAVNIGVIKTFIDFIECSHRERERRSELQIYLHSINLLTPSSTTLHINYILFLFLYLSCL